jgi:hypothetical protein
MRLKTLFTIVAILLFLHGLGITLAPTIILENYGVDANAASTHMARALGGALLAIAIMTWLARNSGPSTARNALVVGLSLFFVLEAVEDIRAIVAGILNPIGWISVVLSIILVILITIAGRSAMSES